MPPDWFQTEIADMGSLLHSWTGSQTMTLHTWTMNSCNVIIWMLQMCIWAEFPFAYFSALPRALVHGRMYFAMGVLHEEQLQQQMV